MAVGDCNCRDAGACRVAAAERPAFGGDRPLGCSATVAGAADPRLPTVGPPLAISANAATTDGAAQPGGGCRCCNGVVMSCLPEAGTLLVDMVRGAGVGCRMEWDAVREDGEVPWAALPP